MISLKKVNKKISTDSNGKDVLQVSLVADTAAEVIAIGTNPATIVGMPTNAVLAPFSTCFTTEQVLLMLGSNGVWKEG